MSEHQHKAKVMEEMASKSAHPTKSCVFCSACVASVGGVQCHAKPPYGFPMFGQGPGGAPVVVSTHSVFPPVNKEMWCREWQEREDGEEVKPLPVPKIIAPPSRSPLLA